LILCSSGRNVHGVTAKPMDGAVPIFDLLLYEKKFPQKIFLRLFSALFRSFTNLTITNVLFRERKAVSSRFHYAAFCGEHRLA
jgi:hypothetical protein